MDEKRRRINVALWAYAYEVMDDPLVSDAKYDETCLLINPNARTGHPKMDDFFREEFSPDTGIWIYKHPEWEGIASIYQRLTGRPAKHIGKFKNESPLVTKAVSNMGFKSATDMKIYLASLGLRVLPHSIFTNKFGQMDFEFDGEFFHVSQQATGLCRSIAYKEYYAQK